jgi:hypothetical protein
MVYDKTLPEDMGNKSEGQVLGKDSRDGPSMSDKVIPGRVRGTGTPGLAGFVLPPSH